MNTGVISNPNAASPTVADEYSQASEGYDRMLGEAVAFAVEKEKVANLDDKDLVDGTESLYDALYQRILPCLPQLEVNGSEGFLDTLKAGVRKVIQLVKDFFHWLHAMIFGKKQRIKRSNIAIDKLIRAGKLRTSPARYPHAAGWLYNSEQGIGYIPHNLSWLENVQKQIIDLLDKETRVQAIFKNAIVSVMEGNQLPTSVLKETEERFANLYQLKPAKPAGHRAKVLGSVEYGVYVGDERLVFGAVRTNRWTERKEFIPDISLVRTIHSKLSTIESKLNAMINSNDAFKNKLIKDLDGYAGLGKDAGSITAVKSIIASYTSHTKKIQRIVLDAILGTNDILTNCFE